MVFGSYRPGLRRRHKLHRSKAALSYTAVMHHGLSFTAVTPQIGLSRRSVSRAIQRAQIAGPTDAIPLAKVASQTTAS